MDFFIEKIRPWYEIYNSAGLGVKQYYLLAVVAVLLLVIIGIPIIVYKIYRKRLRHNFLEKYHIVIPETMDVYERKDGRTDNYIVIRFPRWYSAKKDGTADHRSNYNNVDWKKSYVYVGEYVLISDEVNLIPEVVRSLRKTGVNLPPHQIELAKYNVLKEKRELRNRSINAQGLAELYSSTPAKFEAYCAELLRENGFKAFLTPPTNDGGYDIKAYKDGKSYIIECKCYAPGHIIGRPLIQKLYGANGSVRADKMIFMTTSGYSKAAIQYAEEMDIFLIDGKQLVEMSKIETTPITISEEEWSMRVEDFRYFIPKDIYQTYFH